MSSGGARKHSDWKLFVGQLSYKMDEGELCSLFAQAGEIEHAHMLRQPDGKSRGCGFLVFKNKFMADTAISQFHGRVLPGSNRALTVKYC